MKRFKVFYADINTEGPLPKKKLGSLIIEAKSSKEALKRFAESKANAGKVPLMAQVV